MIYSRFRPDTGLYDYFESVERRALGDDMPAPQLSNTTEIGVASTEVGRTPPGPVRSAGSGKRARGSIMPLVRQGLSGLGLSTVPVALWIAAGVVVGWWLGRRDK